MKTRSAGFTLLEVVLALGLTVVVMLLLGGLLAIYQGSLDYGTDNVRQARIARSVLSMIADDLRGVIRNSQQDDAATLKEFLSSTSASQGGQAAGASQSTGQASSQPSMSTGGQSAGSLAEDASASGASMSGSSTDASATGEETVAVRPPPGLFGSESSIELDVSRPPRIEEYMAEMVDPTSGMLTDIPSDLKTISYYIQAPGIDGVQDPLASLAASNVTTIGSAAMQQNGGLVRRSIDRAVYQWAAEKGQSMQVNRTGQLIAPEVVALSFSYFDGAEWTTSWDSNATGIPWAINISIYMQHAKAARDNPILPGVSMTEINSGLLVDAGLEVYSMIVNIPGAQSLSTPADQQSTDTTDASATSALGF